jgi:hypothetical protein
MSRTSSDFVRFYVDGGTFVVLTKNTAIWPWCLTGRAL